jgi:hypothetical protein
MNRLLIPSDRLVIRSDELPESFRICPAQTPPPVGARLAPDAELLNESGASL